MNHRSRDAKASFLRTLAISDPITSCLKDAKCGLGTHVLQPASYCTVSAGRENTTAPSCA